MQDSYTDRIQTVLMRIVEGFSDYFVSCIKNTYNQTPQRVDVKNMAVERKLGATGIHIVSVGLDSDIGTDNASIAVKIYDQQDHALDVVNKINALKTRITPHETLGISSPSVIFFSGSVVIMEGIQGNVFRNSKIPKPQKYRYAGRSLAAFHGINQEQVWFDKYKLLVKRSLDSLPVLEALKQPMKRKFDDILPEIEKTSQRSGSASFGDFHPGNIIFDVKIGRNPMIRTHLIDPEYLDLSTDHDRLEDISNFFAVEAVNSYRNDPELRKLRMNMKAFLAGYQEFLALKDASLNQYYTSPDLPISFHMALMVLMSILNIQGMSDLFGGQKGIERETHSRIELIERLLQWKTFPE